MGALSPDGSQIAFTWFDSQAVTICVVPVAGGAAHDISIKGATELNGVARAADAKSFL